MPDLPWEAATYRRGDGGFGVVLRLDLTFASEEAAVAAGRYVCGLADVRLGEAVARRLLEAAAQREFAPLPGPPAVEEPPPAGPLPLFQAPS
jgi:hypothetical protein